jgi:hypothetical protein
MSANPEAIVWLWNQLKILEPSTQLGGIYANKSGYHNTRLGNQANWPGNYSIVLPEDKLGPADKASALDWTFPDAQRGDYTRIAKYGKRLLDSGKDPNDPRGNYLREAYFQADNDLAVEGWDYYYVRAASSDSSHLWHIHFSFLRKYCNDMTAMTAVLSILKGETVAQWKGTVDMAVELNKETLTAIAQHVWNIDMVPNPNPDSDKVANPTWAAKNVLQWGATVAYNNSKALAALPDKVVARLEEEITVVGPGTCLFTSEQVKEAVKAALREGTSTSP